MGRDVTVLYTLYLDPHFMNYEILLRTVTEQTKNPNKTLFTQEVFVGHRLAEDYHLLEPRP